MIYIGGYMADTEALRLQIPRGIERLIFDKLANGAGRYSYANEEELYFEIRLRAEIINAAREQSRSGLRFSTFRDARVNPAYWEKTREGGFLLKRGVSAAVAITDIFRNGPMYATECATAIVIIYYKALLNIYKPGLFDRVFTNIELMNWHYLHRNLREIGDMVRAADFIPGDRRYFMNPDVNPLTPELQGENVIDMSGGYYYGHDLGITSASEIIKFLNENRKEGATRSAYLMDLVGRPNFKRLGNIYFSNR